MKNFYFWIAVAQLFPLSITLWYIRHVIKQRIKVKPAGWAFLISAVGISCYGLSHVFA